MKLPNSALKLCKPLNLVQAEGTGVEPLPVVVMSFYTSQSVKGANEVPIAEHAQPNALGPWHTFEVDGIDAK